MAKQERYDFDLIDQLEIQRKFMNPQKIMARSAMGALYGLYKMGYPNMEVIEFWEKHLIA
jgi:hypothetical protein